jgi:LacI family transcriptional regulator
MSDPTKGPAGRRAPGIKDIARELGISIGTVDRALHSRPGINPMTRARVLKMAQTLGYRPNFAARHLKLNRKLRVSIHLPKEIASFFDPLREGIEEAAEPFRSSIDLDFQSYPRLGEHDVELFAEALKQHTNGLILAPGSPADLKPWIRRAARSHIPVVCVSTDAPGTERLCTVSCHPSSSGALAAELLTRFVHRPATALLVTGDLKTSDHAEKINAFRECLVWLKSPLTVAALLEAHDDSKLAYRLTLDTLRQHPDIGAAYISTANSVPVIRALEDSGRIDDVAVVATDLFPALIPFIRSGKVVGTLYQRPKAQGKMAFEALYQFLVEGKCPPVRHRLAPHLILRSNLDLFLETLPGDLDGNSETDGE